MSSTNQPLTPEASGRAYRAIVEGHVPTMVALTRKLIKDRITTTCVSCVFFRGETLKTCSIANNVRPPDEVIVQGCPKWEGLPF